MQCREEKLKIKDRLTNSQNCLEVKNTVSFFDEEKIVFKPMTYDELGISLERLVRFNNPFKKYERVYRDILFKHLISPKLSIKTYNNLNFGIIAYLVQIIWNESVKNLHSEYTENNFINLYLLYEEIKERCVRETVKKFVFSSNNTGFSKPANFSDSTFVNDENILKDIFEHNGIKFNSRWYGFDPVTEIYVSFRMNYPLNIDGFLQLAESQENISTNIKRLVWLNRQVKKAGSGFNSYNAAGELENIYKQAEIYREDHYSKNPLRLVILAEGATEQVLLPVFSSVAGIDFRKNGIEVIDSGGKNQVARIYSELYRELNLPVLIVLDADAYEIAEEIGKNLRETDRLYLISKGEFEDILPDKLICRAINSYYGYTGKVKKSEIDDYDSKTDGLCFLWKQKGFGEFKKAEFAQIIAENIKSSEDLSDEMKEIISHIKEMLL